MRLLGEPRPKAQLLSYAQFKWPSGPITQLPRPTFCRQSFSDVVLSRRSRREFGPLSIDDISRLLWLTNRVSDTLESELGFELSFRPTLSAGAIHPIHMLISITSSSTWSRYDPFSHQLIGLGSLIPSRSEAVKSISEALDPQDGMLIWLAAEPGMTEAKYDEADSLIWRDAGAMLGQLGLVSSYLGIQFCPLGATGENWAMQLGDQGQIRGVGIAIAGSPLAIVEA